MIDLKQIKQMYTMRELIARYGMQINRGGYCRCPFHNGDREPSLKIYERDYYCYACNASGDVISFMMYMEGLSYKDILRRHDNSTKKSFKDYRRLQKIKQEQKVREVEQNLLKLEYTNICTDISIYRQILKECHWESAYYAYYYNKLQYTLYLLEEVGDQLYGRNK